MPVVILAVPLLAIVTLNYPLKTPTTITIIKTWPSSVVATTGSAWCCFSKVIRSVMVH